MLRRRYPPAAKKYTTPARPKARRPHPASRTARSARETAATPGRAGQLTRTRRPMESTGGLPTARLPSDATRWRRSAWARLGRCQSFEAERADPGPIAFGLNSARVRSDHAGWVVARHRTPAVSARQAVMSLAVSRFSSRSLVARVLLDLASHGMTLPSPMAPRSISTACRRRAGSSRSRGKARKRRDSDGRGCWRPGPGRGRSAGGTRGLHNRDRARGNAPRQRISARRGYPPGRREPARR